jgi:prepilin-type N-terminal cleavage/methylation domain-containing protein
MSASTRRHDMRGFTLIEVVIVLGVLALLMSMTLPSFGEAVARQRLKTVAEDLALDLGEARLESLRGTAVHLALRSGADWCWAIGPTPDVDCTGSTVGATKVVRARDYPGVTMSAGASSSFGGRETLAVASTAAEFLSSQGQTLRVHMTPLGRAIVCAPQSRVGDYPRC